MPVLYRLCGMAVCFVSLAASAQLLTEVPAPRTLKTGPVPASNIQFIHMGGNDCPPCRVWRALELPKLQASPLFQSITYSYVTKAIGSPVPPEMFLPAEVKPLKGKLDLASGGRNGSPHQVLLVNGEVYDYWFGERSAEDIMASLQAITSGTRYPFPRCVKRSGSKSGECQVKG